MRLLSFLCLHQCFTQLHYYDATLSEYGKKEIRALAQFYGNEATVTYDGKTYISPPLLGLVPNGVCLKEHY